MVATPATGISYLTDSCGEIYTVLEPMVNLNLKNVWCYGRGSSAQAISRLINDNLFKAFTFTIAPC